MRVSFFFSFLAFILSSWAWAIDPKALCNPDALEELVGFQRDRMEEVCSYSGQYEESLLPDEKATLSGKFREGKSNTYDYTDFFSTLTKSVGAINRSERCPEKSEATPRVSYPSLNLEKTAVGTIPVSVVPEEELNQIFSKIAKDPKYAFDVPENGCWARAHIMAKELEAKGIRVGKMFVEGTLAVRTKKALNGEGVIWSYHVAPLVAVQTKNGVELRILDPSLFDKPVPVKTWTDRMLPLEKLKDETKMYITDRFNLDPLRGQSARSLKRDPSQGRWHKAELLMAEQELEARRMDLEDRQAWRQSLIKNSFKQELEQ